MKQKVFVVLWSYNHKGEFDCGYTIHKTKKDAKAELEKCYNQAVQNISPEDGVYGLDLHEHEHNREVHYYYVERYAADSWERGEIQENEIEF